MSEPSGHAPAAPQLHFSPAEWEQLQADDRHAAAVVLALMTAIFTLGLLLYIGVMYTVL